MKKFCKNVLYKLLPVIFVILFALVIKPVGISLMSMLLLNEPHVGDCYIVNLGKMNGYSLAEEDFNVAFQDSFQAFKVQEFDDTYITCVSTGDVYSHASSLRKSVKSGDAYSYKDNEPGNVIRIPRDLLFRINVSNSIVSAHRHHNYTSIKKLNDAMTCFDEKKFLEASSLLRDVEHKLPNYNTNFLLGNALFQGHAYEEAKKAYMKAISYDGTKAHAYNGVARCYFKLNEHDNAISYHTKAISIDPDQGRSYGLLANVYCFTGDYENALRYYRLSIEKEYINKCLLLNYMEVVLMVDEDFVGEIDVLAEENGYLGDDDFCMKYEMLSMFFAVREGDDISPAKVAWTRTYGECDLGWNFRELDCWMREDGHGVLDGAAYANSLELIAFFKTKNSNSSL